MDAGVIGHFTGEHLEGIADHDDADVFVCGPATLMDAVFDHYETAHPTPGCTARPSPSPCRRPSIPMSPSTAN